MTKSLADGVPDGDSFWLVYSLKKKRSFSVDAYEWGEIVDETINGTINANESRNVLIPSQWNKYDKYDEPRRLKVTVDPDNNVTELNEGNNTRTGTIYTDLTFVEYKKKVGKKEKKGKIHFVQPSEEMLCVLVKQNKISAMIKNNNDTEGIVFPAPREFNISLVVKHPNGTIASGPYSKHYQDFSPINKTLYAGEEEEIVFDIESQIYPDFVGDTKNYKVSVIADSENDINEGNDFYPRGEYNNWTSEIATVYHVSGYTGGDLDNVAHGRVYGDVIYSIGNSTYDVGCVDFNGVKSKIPPNANITVARLYYYWLYWKQHSTASGGMNFNGNSISSDNLYYDDTMATKFPTRWGVYIYDVTEQVRDALTGGGDLEATATSIGDDVHPTGMLLLIVYEDKSKPLIGYWIDEGAFALMADNKKYPTGLLPKQCTANASFDGIVNKTKVSKAELLTVLPSWKKEDLCTGITVGDALIFNDWDVGNPGGTSYWKYEGSDETCMALTSPHWVDVLGVNNNTYLKSHANLAQIQSKGNFMMATNAILKVTYLPDLTVSSLEGPSSVNGGETHKIKATISNIGESKAENFEVKFTASDGTLNKPEETINLLEGLGSNNNTKTVEFTWTAPDKLGTLEQIKIQNVTINVTADSEGEVEELNESNNEDAKNVVVTITEKPFTPRGGGGSGTDIGLGEGDEAVAEAGATTAGSGEATIGASGGRAITGRLMKGAVASSEAAGGGGGERGEFSLVKLLMRLAMLAAAVSLVCAGYLLERRRQRHKQ
ncbi:MAG: DUF3344 domain-containing protein [Euryarchaeota archaeon]|nr:DUF3344 domain-containing protein [Euryarchaeota archaeon]